MIYFINKFPLINIDINLLKKAPPNRFIETAIYFIGNLAGKQSAVLNAPMTLLINHPAEHRPKIHFSPDNFYFQNCWLRPSNNIDAMIDDTPIFNLFLSIFAFNDLTDLHLFLLSLRACNK